MRCAIRLLLLLTCGPFAAGCSRETPPASIELWVGGDLHVDARFADPLGALDSLVGDGAGIVNLEGPTSASTLESSERRLTNPIGIGALLRSHRIAAIGIANNHALDLGPDGQHATRILARLCGIEPVGATPAKLRLGGKSVAITAHDLSDGLPANLRAELAAAASDDLAIATFHVKGPPSYLPSPELRAAVEIAVDAGSDVIAAHGTHAIGPVERRGQVVIAWGLGNLAFACDCTDEVDGLILKLSIGSNRIDAAVVPIRAGLRGEPMRAADDPALIFELLESLGSSPISRAGDRAFF